MKEMQFSIVVLMVLMCSALIVLMPESVRNNKVINRSRWLMVGALALIGLQFLIQYITQLRAIGVTQAVLVNLIVLLPASALMDLAILNLQRWGRLIEVERWGWIVAWAIVTGGLTIAVVSDGKPFAQLSERVWWAEIAMSAVYAAMQACYSVLQLKELTRMQADIENYYDSQNKGLTGWLKYAIGVNGLLAVFVPMLIFGPNILLLVFALLFFWGIFMMWFCFVRYFVSNAMSRVREAEKSAEESARKQQEQKSENSSLTTEEDTLSAETMQQVDMAVERWIAANGHLQAGIPTCPPEGVAGTGMVATNAVKQRTGNGSAGTSSKYRFEFGFSFRMSRTAPVSIRPVSPNRSSGSSPS